MKPFKIGQQPSVNVNETHAAPSPPPGKLITESMHSGHPLPSGGTDQPCKNPQLAYPQPVMGVDKLPFKNTK